MIVVVMISYVYLLSEPLLPVRGVSDMLADVADINYIKCMKYITYIQHYSINI